jgi:hypothetical protein
MTDEKINLTYPKLILQYYMTPNEFGVQIKYKIIDITELKRDHFNFVATSWPIDLGSNI